MKLDVWDYVFWFFILLTIVLLIWRMFGHTPLPEALLITIIGSELGLWKVMYKHGRELTGIKKDLEYIKKKL